MIEFCHISKSFKKDFWIKPFYALDDVSFKIEKGDATGFLGANGAGKTTLLKILMGFIRPDSGEIIFDKSLGDSREQVLENIGFLPERPYFYPHLTGRDFAFYMGRLNDVPRERLKKEIFFWASRLGVEDALDRPLKGYSKGMLQRLGLTTALLHNPDILILDEPLSGLDPVGRKDIKNVIQQLAQEGKTVFVSSHIVSDIEEICEKVVVLEHGKRVYDGSIEALISKNSSSAVEIICQGSIPHLERVTAEELQGNQTRLLVELGDKNSILKTLIEHQVDVKKIEPQRPSLEEVIYNIKG
jgi:ABC-2 type transport system ATP-binding protein